ncbi:MAG: hypothetical protein WEE67_10240 [Chloroflexota bacterium]
MPRLELAGAESPPPLEPPLFPEPPLSAGLAAESPLAGLAAESPLAVPSALRESVT